MPSKNPQITIIVPAYNVERYISQCLQSIIDQRFSDYECIIINDGSTDNTKGVIEKTVANDSRFIPLDQQNSGVSVARNVGLKRACGQYVIFLDADDHFHPDLLKELFTSIRLHNADIAVCDFDKFNGQNNQKIDSGVLTKEGLPEQQVFKFLDRANDKTLLRGCGLALWNKLFRKKLLVDNGIIFDPRVRLLAEDALFSTLAMLTDNCKVAVVHKSLVCYRVTCHDGKVTTNSVSAIAKYPLDPIKAYEIIKKRVDTIDNTLLYKRLIDLVIGGINFYIDSAEQYPTAHRAIYEAGQKLSRSFRQQSHVVRNDFVDPYAYDFFLILKDSKSYEEFLHQYLKLTRERLVSLNATLSWERQQITQQENELVQQSNIRSRVTRLIPKPIKNIVKRLIN